MDNDPIVVRSYDAAGNLLEELPHSPRPGTVVAVALNKPGIARVTDVIDVPVGGNERGIDHSAIFPPALAEHLIRTFCPPQGTVLDCFAGSGSTLVAAKRLGHDYYGIEIVGKFCQEAQKRLRRTELSHSKPKAG